MKQTVTISQNMGCNPAIIKTPNIMFPTGNRRPTFDNQLIKKKEFKSINTVNSSGPDMSKTTIQIPLKDHVKASYSNGDLKKMSFIGKDDIVNTFYTPPIQIKQNIKSIAGLSSVDTGLLSGLSDMGSNVAKGVAMLTMQNILKIDNDGKTSLKSVFSADKQRTAELALQNYKSRQSSIASSRGWGAEEITKKNKESIDLYIAEIEPLINSADEKKAFNEILLSSSSSMTQKLMPVDPTLLTATPTGASATALADALKTAVIEGMKASMPVGGGASAVVSSPDPSGAPPSPTASSIITSPSVSPVKLPADFADATHAQQYPFVDIDDKQQVNDMAIPPHLKQAIEQFVSDNSLSTDWYPPLLAVYDYFFADQKNYNSKTAPDMKSVSGSDEDKEVGFLTDALEAEVVKLQAQSANASLSSAGNLSIDTDDTETIKLGQKITEEDIEKMIDAITGPQRKGNQDLTLKDLGQILIESNLYKLSEYRGLFQSKNAQVLKTNLAKEALVKAMKGEQKGAAILENIAYGVKTGNGSAMQVWTEIRDNQKDYKQEYLTQQSQPSTPRNQPTAQPAGGNGRKRKKNTQNKAQVHLKEIAKILQKYAN